MTSGGKGIKKELLNAPMSHGPVDGRAFPAISTLRVLIPKEVKLFPFFIAGEDDCNVPSVFTLT